MEELFVYALLYSEGFDVWSMYTEALDKIFLENPENEEYLSLEEMMPKEAVLHNISIMRDTKFNVGHFGKILMKSLRQIYEEIALEAFGRKMYSLWKKLPERIKQEEPFFIFCYADDCLSYGDENQCRQLYEEAMRYYN